MRVAVLGTGTMGIGMARSLLTSGIEVTAWNRHSEKAAPLADAGARIEQSAAAAVADADVVLTMLFDEKAVAEVAGEFLPSMADGAIWMQCATVGPAGMKRLADLATQHAVRVVDSPVVGTKKPASEGKLVVLVSGDADRIDRLGPVLDAISSKTVTVGTDIGAASSLKLACNAWIAAITAATAQSLAICSLLDVDPQLFLDAIDGGAADSPYAHLKGAMMIGSDFSPSFATDGLVKDIGLMIDAVGADNPAARILVGLHGAFGAASDAGHGSDDVAAVISSFTGRPGGLDA